MLEQVKIITILGHTAGGKTHVAALTAKELGSEIISADSRQVYRGMTIGTGKDYSDYIVDSFEIPYHLIDIRDAGEEYNVFEFQKDFFSCLEGLEKRGVSGLLCGGSGLYIESVLRHYDMVQVPLNKDLRAKLEKKDMEELVQILSAYRDLHNTSDSESRKRVVRAIEIADYMQKSGTVTSTYPEIHSLTIGINFEREERRNRITRRLEQRLKEGLLEEAQALIDSGVSHEKMEYYGLEYKYLSRYLRGALSYNEMFVQLNTAIHQFAKRQMTYFRGMEKRGIQIHWLDGRMSDEEKVRRICKLYQAI